MATPCHPVCASSTTCLVQCSVDGCTNVGTHYLVVEHSDGDWASNDDIYCADHPNGDGYVVEIRDPQGGRNLIRGGDRVHVKSKPGKRDGFDAMFVRAKVVGGIVTEVEVYGGKAGRGLQQGQAMFRTFVPERIERRSQTKAVAS